MPNKQDIVTASNMADKNFAFKIDRQASITKEKLAVSSLKKSVNENKKLFKSHQLTK